jgi:hypothetical protein
VHIFVPAASAQPFEQKRQVCFRESAYFDIHRRASSFFFRIAHIRRRVNRPALLP